MPFVNVNGKLHAVKNKGRLNVVKGFISELLACTVISENINENFEIILQPILHLGIKSCESHSFTKYPRSIHISVKSKVRVPVFASNGCIMGNKPYMCTYAKLLFLPSSLLDKDLLRTRSLKRGQLKELLNNLAHLPPSDIIRSLEKNVEISFMEEALFLSFINIPEKLDLTQRREVIIEHWKKFVSQINKNLLKKKENKLLLLVNPLIGAYILAQNTTNTVYNALQTHIEILDFLVSYRDFHDILVIVRDDYYFINKALIYEVKSSERAIIRAKSSKIKENLQNVKNVEFYMMYVRPGIVDNDKISFKLYKVA